MAWPATPSLGAAIKIQVTPGSEISGQVLNDEAIAEAADRNTGRSTENVTYGWARKPEPISPDTGKR
jgi:hypothetical protein